MPPAHAPALAAQSFRKWRDGDSLHAAIVRAETNVRTRPADLPGRWLLFELLCVTGTWDRALKQLQTCAMLDPELDGTAKALRGLIRAERQREEIFAGRQMPVPVLDLPGWMAGLARALERNAAQDYPGADALRQQALQEAEEAAFAVGIAGQGNLGRFEWITDSDTRLGPVCELVSAGCYRWISFTDLRRITLAAPARLLDLVWIGADLVLRDGSLLKAYLPSRYPVAASTTDALRLARETTWRDVGASGVFAQGQKTWMTDEGDWPLLDVRQCEFTTTAAPPARPDAA